MSIDQTITKLVWMDLEMTGLDPVQDEILQIGCLVTDTELNILEGGLDIAIHKDEERLQQMNEWNRDTHTKSGLWKRCVESELTPEQAEQQVIDFISQYVEPKQSPLCGNSIAQDRAFLQIHMYRAFDYLHYRSLDVSTLKQLYQLWSAKPKFQKAETHDAMEDIRESIAELKHYRKEFLLLD